MSTLVAAFYQFSPNPDADALTVELRAFAEERGLVGTLLVADEGINGTLAGTPDDVHAMLDKIRSMPGFEAMRHKEASHHEPPFLRLKVRKKAEIVTLGVPVDPNARVGTYVKPADWNELIARDDIVLVDVRNDYEVHVGSFEGAIDPLTQSFGEFPEWVNKELAAKPKVAMFCTGGIRCEKASSLLLEQGFGEVFHLEGGILKYLEEVPAEQSKWNGQCFVFDERISVGHGLVPGELAMCYGCRRPLNPEDLESEHYEEGVCCAACFENVDEERKARRRVRYQQQRIARRRGRQA